VSGPASVLSVALLLTLCGFGVLAAVGVSRSPAELAYRFGLAPLTGMACAGIVGATLATAGARLSIAGLIGLTIGTCTVGAIRLHLTPTIKSSSTGVRRRSRTVEHVVAITALAIVTFVGLFALAAFRVKPLAEYDGWAMWGMKARAIAILGSADADVFASEAYERLHVEYPLLLPTLHALPLQLTDGFSSNTVILNCFVVGISGLLAIWALFRGRVRTMLLLPFVAAIAAMPAFFVQLGSGYADVPLALFVAGGLAASARWITDCRTDWIVLATIFLAAAVLTKDEGLLFAAGAYIALLLAATGRRRAVVVSALTVALAYAPWRAYITVHQLDAPHYDLSSSFDIPWVARRLDRGPEAIAGLLDEALDPRQFGLLVALGVVASLLAFLVGPRSLGIFASGFALLSLAGLTWIYVITPYDLPAYLGTNAHRVVMAVVVGLGALCPLLFEECARTLAEQERSSARTGSLVTRDSHESSVLRRRSAP
jgi:hypothetical protein